MASNSKMISEIIDSFPREKLKKTAEVIDQIKTREDIKVALVRIRVATKGNKIFTKIVVKVF